MTQINAVALAKILKIHSVQEENHMLYPYMTLADNTEIVHSEMKIDGTVLVIIETPINGGFKSAKCILPMYEWTEIEGYTDDEVNDLKWFVERNSHLIMEFAQCGGILNATAV